MSTALPPTGGNHHAAELAVSSVSAQAKALIEAKFTIALHRPRSLSDARRALLDAAKRPRFAESARYKKPVGGGYVEGPSIRFAEEALRALTNVDVSTTLLFEDDRKRLVRITVTDLESNLSYGDDIAIEKTVERNPKNLRGREVVAERTNSSGDTVCICLATEDELANKIAAAKSKVIRNSGLRVVPSDIVEEVMEAVAETLSKGGEDPKAAAKRVLDSMASMGVSASDVSRYLGHSTDAMSPAEIADLRLIYSALKDGETTWRDVIETKSAQSEPKRSVGKPKFMGGKPKFMGGKDSPPSPADGGPGDPDTGRDAAPHETEPEAVAESQEEIPLDDERMEFREIVEAKLSKMGLPLSVAMLTMVDLGMLTHGDKWEDIPDATFEALVDDWEPFAEQMQAKVAEMKSGKKGGAK